MKEIDTIKLKLSKKIIKDNHRESKDLIHCLNNGIFKTNSEENFTLFSHIIENLVPSDGPDFYFNDQGTVYVVENFYFDSSRNNKKGSLRERQHGEDLRKCDKYLKDKSKNTYVGGVEYERSAQDYVLNFKHVLSEHYVKINVYKLKLLESLNAKRQLVNFKIIFHIIDKSDFGTSIQREGQCIHLMPYNFKDLQDFVLNLDNIDYFLLSEETLENRIVSWFGTREEFCDKTIRSFKTNDLKLIEFNPISISTQIFIPVKNVK